MEKLIEELTDIFECEEGELEASTIFKDNEMWDSLAALSLLASIDDIFSVVLTEEDFEKTETISDLYKLICSKE